MIWGNNRAEGAPGMLAYHAKENIRNAQAAKLST
jgi:hypothetical protein